MAQSGNVRLACEAVAIDRRTAYRLREDDASFAADWEHAQDEAADLLEQEARRRAYQGVQRVKFHKGYPIMVPALDDQGLPIKDDDGKPIMVPYIEHEYSDTLMIFLMKATNPEKYRERQQIEHVGKGGGAIELAAVDYRTGLDALKPDADT